MDTFYAQISQGNVGVMRFVDPQLLERMPSEYWDTNCRVAASFLHRDDCARRDRIGVDHIMWGSDYPHNEGTAPFSHEAIRLTFGGVPEDEVRAMLGTNAAEVYGFDVELLAPLAERFGPTVDEVMGGLDEIPDGAESMAFRNHAPANV
jgi:hypothetical protein